MTKKELKTYQDIVNFVNKLEDEQFRLLDGDDENNLAPLKEKKYNILNVIKAKFIVNFGITLHPDSNHGKKQYQYCPSDALKKPDDVVNKQDINACIKAIEDAVTIRAKEGQTGTQYINEVLGTHQNWFKWLLSFLFDAPKSKQFIDGFSLFDQSTSGMNEQDQESPSTTHDTHLSPKDT